MQKTKKVMVCLVLVGVFLLPISAFHIPRETTNGTTVTLFNNPPSKPTLEGSQRGVPKTPYYYTACATDPDGDRIFYTYNWGDGTQTTMSCCFASGECCTACYCWCETGTYYVRVCAVDCHHCYGEWSDFLPVVMPINHSPNFTNYFILNSPVSIEVN